MPRTEELYLRDVIESADLISDYVDGLTLATFREDQQRQDSVLYRLMIIGEAAAHVSQATRLRYPHIEWQDIVAFRNFAVHVYFALDLAIAWNAATRNVPLLRREIKSILDRDYSSPSAVGWHGVGTPGQVSTLPLPDLVVHADWSTSSKKRWMERAVLGVDGRYRLLPPEPVGDTTSLLRGLQERARASGSAMIGFDFPIGLPAAYARRAGIDDFIAFLHGLGNGEWPEFFEVAERLDEVRLQRPFFPRGVATGLKQPDFLIALGFTKEELYRRCERARPDRAAAAPLFWTVGGNQAGKAALAGWREVLCPAISDPALEIAIWPFGGSLNSLLQSGRIIVAETYPAECYVQLGLDLRRAPTAGSSGKRIQSSRAANAPTLLAWAEANGADLDPRLNEALGNGFGPSEAGEDLFDAVVGLFGMLNVILGRQSSGEPADEQVHRIEGWILGQSE
ncbi:MAG: hypothetical protein QOF01_563 [Thermomicrobiales bacterium]|nr:hypothetical protein [Thermomicrobiales bacterium]